MNTRSLLPALALAACTPETASRLVESDLTAQVREHKASFAWSETPLVPGLEPSYQVRTPRLRVYLSPDGLHAIDRAQTEPRWTLDLVTDGYGRRDATRPLARGSLWAEGRQAESVHGDVVEYADHTEDGLMHGFRLLHPPEGSGPVQLRMRVGGAEPHATDDGAVFVVPGEATIGWRGLRVFDADGVVLPASTHVEADHLVVDVDDAGAAWPITVDPLLATVEATVYPAIGPTSPRNVGYSIAADGDRIVVGNPGDPAGTATNGAAALLERNVGGSDDWGIQRTFDSNTSAQREGFAVAIDAFVAASASKDNVYLYEYATTWSSIVRPTLTLTKANQEFGTDLALFGDGLVVGAPGFDDGPNDDRGRLYLYDQFEDWVERAENVAPVGQVGDRLGTALAADAGRILAGAPGNDAAVLFEVNGDSDGDGSSEIARFEGPANSDFGVDVALSADRAVIAAPLAGQVYTYRRYDPAVAGDWSSEVVLDAPPEAGTGFGRRVALTSDTLAVTEDGKIVHLFSWSGSGWTQTHLLDVGAFPTATLPFAVTLTDSLLAVGIPSTGGVRVWRRTGSDYIEENALAPSGAAGDRLGEAVSISGDVVVAGAPASDPNGVGSGAAYIFTRDESGDFVYHSSLDGYSAGDAFGSSVDVSRDGIIVGAPKADDGLFLDSGAAWAYSWDGNGVNLLGEIRPLLVRSNGNFGAGVATDGDKFVIACPSCALTSAANDVYRRYTPTSDALALLGYFDGDSGDFIGSSGLAISGTWLAGASESDGVVTLQRFNGLDEVERTRLTDPLGGPLFGSDIALSDNTLAVLQSPNTVHIYRNDGPAWTLDGTLTIEADSISLDENRLVTGDTVGTERWSVQERNFEDSSKWGEQSGAAISGNDDAGWDIDIDGDTVVIGAPAANSSEGKILIETLTENLAPFCRAETFVVNEDVVSNTGSVAANEHDPNGDSLTYVATRNPTHDRSFTLSTSGAVTYQGDVNYNGTDSFEYEASDGSSTCRATASLTITAVNDSPVALADGPYFGTEDTPYVSAAGILLANDTDVDSTVFTTIVASSPSHGTLALQTTGAFTYTPDPDWSGDDSFTYRTLDNANGQSAPATVSITIAPVNDAPTYAASFVAAAVSEDEPYVSPPPGLLEFAEDVDGDTLLTSFVSGATHGVATIESNGYWRYVPVPDYQGPDQFSFDVSDGVESTSVITVNVTVTPVNDAPIGNDDGVYALLEDDVFEIFFPTLLANDGDVDGDDLEVNVGPAVPEGVLQVDLNLQKLTFTPRADLFGPVTLTYRAKDPGGLETEDIPIRLEFVAVNDVPVANGDVGSSTGGAPATGNVLTNDIDADADALTASLSQPPREGTATVAANGDFSYSPREGYEGQDQFTYAVSDPSGATARALVTVNVTDNDPEGPGTGTTDEPVEPCTDPETWYADQDGDGFGDAAVELEACAPPGYVADATDCDDRDNRTYPKAYEASGDGIDQDCDGRDNLPTAVGTCDHAGSASTAPLLGLGLVLLRRRRTSAR